MKSQKKDRPVGESGGFCGCLSVSREKNLLLFSQIAISEEEIVPASKILQMLLYEQDASAALLRCRLNPNLLQVGFREDLEYFIPQLIQHILRNNDDKLLLGFIAQACQVDFFFAHTFFFAWRSEVRPDVPEVENYLKSLMQELSRVFHDTLLVAAFFEDHQFENGIPQQVSKGMTPKHGRIPSGIKEYGTQFYQSIVINDNICLSNYRSVFRNAQPTGFCSTIDFWDDIIHISQNLHLADPKLISLKADIQKINRNLPAAVYVPFQGYRNNVVLNIVIDQLKVFSTKCRSPFYVCIEVYRPEIEKEIIPNPQKQDRVSLPRTVGNWDRKSLATSNADDPTQDCTRLRPTIMCKIVEAEEEEEQKNNLSQILQNTYDVTNSYYDDLNTLVSQYQPSSMKPKRKSLQKCFFPEDQTEKIREKSPFKSFRTWTLVHLIVKSGDDLKQEQFAMQLIQLFDQIFKAEKLNLHLTTYEVISLGPGYGIIECVQNALSVDSFKQKLQEVLKCKSLAEYYKLAQSQVMIQNFLNSLVAYSLVCYFLQIKDRHNGNILIHKDGYIVHIDFGFLLSSAPKGALEKQVPFKLLTEYVDILGGVNSNLFQRFRRMFYQGFQAIRKYKAQILLLVRLFENSDLRCFKSDTLQRLEERFLEESLSENDLYVECQRLIDKSLDNWRAKWYDKYQYYIQNIFY